MKQCCHTDLNMINGIIDSKIYRSTIGLVSLFAVISTARQQGNPVSDGGLSTRTCRTIG